MAVIGGVKDYTADVFDFFDTPRNDATASEELHTGGKKDSKFSKNNTPQKHGGFHAKPKTMKQGPSHRRSRSRSSSDSMSRSSDSDSSEIETEYVSSYKQTNIKTNGRAVTPANEVDVKGENYSSDSFNSDESSSAYSDGSSDDEDLIETEREKYRQRNDTRDKRFERPSDLVQHKPPVQQRKDTSPQREAWSTSGIQKIEIRQPQKNSDDEESYEEDSYKRVRPKSSKLRTRNGQLMTKERSKSGSESEMTDVSPLPSPRQSPVPDKHSQTVGKSQVQYGDYYEPEIKLDSDKIDLSVLMDAVQEIEKERERAERLRVNSRRVMFAPPKAKSKSERTNYSYDKDRTTTIEKENQRLLKEIMKHVGPTQKKMKGFRSTSTESLVQRLTPSAVNRRKEQRRIENDNMAMLRRLQLARSTRGMSRDEQLTDYKRTVLYGVPIAAVHDSSFDDTVSEFGSRSVVSACSSTSRSRRSRPCSAKSNASLRPGSAKSGHSVASSIRPTSAKSTANSVRSVRSVRSGIKTDHRPDWDNRFPFS